MKYYIRHNVKGEDFLEPYATVTLVLFLSVLCGRLVGCIVRLAHVFFFCFIWSTSSNTKLEE